MWRLTWAVTMAMVLHSGRMAEGKCEYNPIGLEDTVEFPSGSFVATSEQGNYPATNVRFDQGGWCADAGDSTKQLTIDFGRLFKVCAVETAGIVYQDGQDAYIFLLYVSFSVDYSTWEAYQPALFNPDKNSIYHPLTGSDEMRVARYIRFTVIAHVNQPCLKVKVYRDKGECANHPVGISDSFIIPDGNLQATSVEGGLVASKARMSDSEAWCFTGSGGELTINLGESVQVCGIETRGYEQSGNERSTTAFSLQFSDDGASYTNYQENGNQRVFTRIRGIGTEFHSLFQPFTAKYIKVIGLDSGSCLKVEVYRSDAGSCYDSTISSRTGPFGDGNTDASFPATDAVLNANDQAWCTSSSAPNAYLQINFGSLKVVCAVAVQGLSDGSNNVFPKRFKLSFAYDNVAHEWADMYTVEGDVREFVIAPVDGNVIVKRELAVSQVARYMRFYPTESSGAQFCLRVAVYGRDGGFLRYPVGITDSFIIPDARITATNTDSSFPAANVRMSDSSAWCLSTGQTGYLQVNFGESVRVGAVETRGYDNNGEPWYAHKFELSYSNDGSTFTKYTEDGSTRVFRKGNPLGQEIHMLNEPKWAKAIRFEPVDGQASRICTNLEVYNLDRKDSCYGSRIYLSGTEGDSQTVGGNPASHAGLNVAGRAWCTTSSASNAYLQLNFDEVKVVCALNVQGQYAASGKRVTEAFKLSFATSEVSNEWNQYYEEGGSEREFIISPADGNVIVNKQLAISQAAKYMRFYPTRSSDNAQFCLRVEVYGRSGGGCLRFPVGLSDSSIIPDASITATNSDLSYPSNQVRMSDSSAWCLPNGQSGFPYLQVDFGENVVLCAVETRGYDNGVDELYAQEFKLSYATNFDGDTFTNYKEGGLTRTFQKGLPTGQEIHMLKNPFTARKVRFEPVTDGSQICTSLEFYHKNTEVSECQVADWSSSFDYPGWSTCGDSDNFNTYIRGLYRNNPGNPDNLYLLEEAKCCNPASEVYNYENPTSASQECQDVDFSSLQGTNVWASCPPGYFLRGLNQQSFSPGSNGLSLISQGKCCRPKHHPDEYGHCVEKDVSSSFDFEGWSSCDEGYFITGLYKSNCDRLYCLETFRCCSLNPTIQGPCFSEKVPFVSITSDGGTLGSYPATDGILDKMLNAWCTSNSYPDAYLQIDFGEHHVVCAVSVQGRYTGSAPGENSFATKFKLAFAVANTDLWSYYKEDNEDREYVTAPANGDWIVNSKLATSQMARYIRFYPTETSPANQACLRVQVYGRKVIRVTCNNDGSVVARIAREALGPAINTLNLNDPSSLGCSVSVSPDNFDDIELRFNVNECGTENTKEGDYIVSTNRITGVATGGIVMTYDTDFTLRCEHNAKDTVLNSITPLQKVGDTDSGSGALEFSFNLYSDSARSTAYVGQQINLQTYLYARIQDVSNPDYLITRLDRCWATPTSDRDHPTFYDFIVDSCGVGDAMDISYACNTADTIQDFVFKAARFSGYSGFTHLHCDVTVCPIGAISECYQSCINACSFRKRRSLNQNSTGAFLPKTYSLDARPIRVVTEAQQDVSSAQEAKKQLSTAAISGIFVGCVAVLATLCATLFMVARRYRKKSEDNQTERQMDAGTTGTVNQAVNA